MRTSAASMLFTTFPRAEIYAPRAVLFNVEFGATYYARITFGNETRARAKIRPKPNKKLSTSPSDFSLYFSRFCSKLRAHTGARSSIRFCVGPELAPCVHNYPGRPRFDS
jgi:hypothetical protein